MALNHIFCIRTKRCANEKLLWMFSTVMWLFSLSSVFIDATPVQITKVEAFNFNEIENINILPDNINKTLLNSLIKIKTENSYGVPFDNSLIHPTFSMKTCDYTSEPLPIIFKNETDILLSLRDIKFAHTEGYLCYRAENETDLHHMGVASKFVNKR